MKTCPPVDAIGTSGRVVSRCWLKPSGPKRQSFLVGLKSRGRAAGSAVT
jgi:hypothetical protein